MKKSILQSILVSFIFSQLEYEHPFELCCKDDVGSEIAKCH